MTARLTSSGAAGRRGVRALALATVIALAYAPGAGAQDPLDAGPTDGLFSLPRSQDDIAEWQEARADIAGHRYEAAVERLHRLLRSDSRGVVPILGVSDRWTGVRSAVIETLRSLPDAGIQAYERLCRREAGRTYDAPISTLSEEQLAFLSRGFPTSSRGILARLRLGDLALVRGGGPIAQWHFRAALDALPQHDARADAIGARLRVADLLTRAAVGPADATDPTTEDAIVALPTFGDVGWAAYGGGYDGARPMDDPIGEPGEPYRLPVHADGFEINDFAMHAVGDLRAIFVNDGHSVRAVDPVGRTVTWEGPGPMVDSDDIADARGAINTDMILSCALSDDLVIASLQVPNEVVGANQTHRYRDVISIVQKIPSRRLFAFDRTTGRRVWAHWDFEGGPTSTRFRGHDACGTPIVHGDAVYVPTHNQTGAIAFYLSSYDLHTGEPRWRRLICSSQQEVNMFGNARQEFAAGPIAVADGVVFGTTNLGLCYAVDAQDGEVRWLSAYPVIPLPRTRLRDQERRPVFFANNPIAIADGVLATTPLDSEFALGFDVETGQLLWQLPYDFRNDMLIRWMLGAMNGEFVFGGLGLVAVTARPEPGQRPSLRIVASPEALGEDHYQSIAIPRGGLTADRIWFVGSDGGLRILDSRGNRDPRTGSLGLGRRGTGNLLMTDGIVAAISGGQLLAWADVDQLIRDARQRAAEADAAPTAVLRLALLLRARGIDDPAALEKLYERGLAAAEARGLGAGTPVYRQLADGLFDLTMDRAENTSDATAARALFEAARARATSARQWLRAQQALLLRSERDRAFYTQELARLAERFPDEVLLFPGVGRVPAGVFAAWHAIEEFDDPRQAAMACQRLMERHGEVTIGTSTAGQLAKERLAALIAEHGQEILAEIEAEASAALDAAGDEPDALRRVVRRYPLTRAAGLATDRLLDVALADGDFGTFMRAYAAVTEGVASSPGAARRLVVAARAGRNAALAHAVAERLRNGLGGQVSGFAPDAGKSFADALADVPPPPAAVTRRPDLPLRTVARLTPPNAQSSYGYLPVRVARGFPTPDVLPLFASPSDGEMVAFDLATEPFDPSSPLASVSIRGALDGPVLLCGHVAVAVDAQRAFGVDLESGELSWELPAARPGGLSPIGVEAGVLHLFALDDDRAASGGMLIGVEPITGTVLFESPIDGDGIPATPVASASLLWTLDASDAARPWLHGRDPLNGRVTASTPIPTAALRFLGVDGPQARRLADPTIRGAIFADARRVYLPVDLRSPEEPSRMVALDRSSGEVAWEYSGLPGCTIQRAGRRGDRVVLFEKASAFARLVILGDDGKLEDSFDFGSMAAVRNWDRFPHPEPAPEIALVTDLNGPFRLTAISVDRTGPRIQPRLDNVARFLQNPLIGDGYLLVPYSRPSRANPVVDVLDLTTQAGALPNGERALTLDVPQHVKFHPHGRHLVVESLDVILVLARNE